MFRRLIPMAACLAALAACSFDTAGSLRERDGSVPEPSDAATPDASPVACTVDDDCAAPASACQLAGTCDLDTNRCVFPDKDCTGEADECNIGTCNPVSGACEKLPAFNGNPCGAETTCEAFSACGNFDADDACDETGTRSRECTDFACSVGACVGTARNEVEECTRDQDGVACGEELECDAFGPCQFASICAETGTESRSCVAFTCADASCEAGSPFIDTRSCNRPSRDGTPCGTTTCGPFGDCGGFSSTCDERGSRSRRCEAFTCDDEICVGDDFVDTATCSRDTGDVVCGRIVEDECPGVGTCPMSCSEPCFPTCTNVTCSRGSCPMSSPGSCPGGGD